ncbi:hypothetical protein [Pararobbsia silviterrae]|uniref:hypothetical protein n=1 Tax=Pararobbsia silviterrae TaxID=1792498 RepID=UPI0011C499D9|nr:hypothetical protein [Pararobbsia silviterrae]
MQTSKPHMALTSPYASLLGLPRGASKKAAATSAAAPNRAPKQSGNTRPTATTTRSQTPFSDAMGGFRGTASSKVVTGAKSTPHKVAASRSQAQAATASWPEMANGAWTGRHIDVRANADVKPTSNAVGVARQIIAADKKRRGEL